MKVLSLISNPIIWLKNYLTMGEAEKGRELAGYSPYTFLEWYLGLDPSEDPETDEATRLEYEEKIDNYGGHEAFTDIPDEFFQEYSSEASSILADDPQAPSFLHMDYEGIVKNDWLIHFTNNIWDIINEGFTKGVADPEYVALTTHLPPSMKEMGGYNFAFDLSNLRSAFGRWGPKYGKEAVMFRASGIRVYHYGDQEHQVIFLGESARDLVPITQDPNTGEWAVGSHPRTEEPLYKNDDLGEVATWVENNYNQYKRLLK
jgi:hypothetical protein